MISDCRRSYLSWCLMAPALILLNFAAACAQGQAPAGPPPITLVQEQKVDAMVHALSLQQKIDLLGGADGMAIRSVPEIGMRPLRMSDGPLGVRSWGTSTAYAPGSAWRQAGTQNWRTVLG